MGCDIHGVLQVKYPTDGWYTVETIERTRNYVLFSVLAGVRNHFGTEPIQEGRGLPEDVRLIEQTEQDGDSVYSVEVYPPGLTYRTIYAGDHSRGWCTLQEFKDWPYWNTLVYDDPEWGAYAECCGVFWKWLEYVEKKYNIKDFSKARIVFDFDS